MANFCTKCGKPVKETDAFCRACGASLRRAQPPARQPEYPQPAAPRPQQPAYPQSAYRQPAGRQMQQPAYPPQYRQPQAAGRKRRGGIIAAAAVALAVIGAVGFFGLREGGFLRGSSPGQTSEARSQAGIREIKGSNIIEFTPPALSRQRELVLKAGNSAMQSHVAALLKTEALSRAAETGVPKAELERLIDEAAEAWQNAGSVSAKAYRMAQIVEMQEQKKSYQGVVARKTGLVIENPFVVRAYAADSKKDTAIAWAHKITEMYDAGPTGRQVRTLAEQLGVDAKTAFAQITMAQNIIKGEAEMEEADLYDMAYKAALAVKTTGKVCAVVAGGLPSTAVGAVLFTGSAVDAVVEVGETSSTIILGEDSKVTATIKDVKNTVAPVTGVIGAVGVFAGSWEKAGDVAGQLTYLSDFAHEAVEDKTILGGLIDTSGAMKMVGISAPETEKEADALKKDLEELTGDDEKAEALFREITEGAEDPGIKPLEEIPPEVLEELIEEADFGSPEESIDDFYGELWESLDESWEAFEDENFAPIALPEDPEEWQDMVEELFIPDELVVQDSDSEGFDDPSKWAKPEPPLTDPEPELPPETEPPEPDETEPPEEIENGDELPAERLTGSYRVSGTDHYVDFQDADVSFHDSTSDTYALSGSGNRLRITAQGTTVSLEYDPETGKAVYYDPDDGMPTYFTFYERDGVIGFTYSYDFTDAEGHWYGSGSGTMQ